MSDFHIVRKGDTLGKIAKRHRLTVRDLQAINQLPDINKLKIGQRIRVKRETVLGLQALVLDRDRNPITGLAYQFEFAGRLLSGVTDVGGLTRQIVTATAADQVRILVQRFDQTWKEIATVTSGYGNKLVTLVSPSVKVEAKTQPHPPLPPGQLPKRQEAIPPLHDTKAAARPSPDKKAPGLVTTVTKTAKSEPLVKVEGDVFDFGFLANQPDLTELTDADFEDAAEKLGVTSIHIKTVTEVEANGRFFWTTRQFKSPIPPILFERHKFSRHTNRKFDSSNPDVSSRTAGGYSGGAREYRRLAKAALLHYEAALMSASWGAFQIMGEHYSTLGFQNVEDFTRYLSTSKKNQLSLFVKACILVNPKWKTCLQRNDWEGFARNYNGKNYWQNEYDKKLNAAFLRLSNKF